MTNCIAPIATPPWTTLGKKMESMVRKALHEFELIQNQKKIGIALSGGKDSLTLLYLLKAISGKGFPPFEIVCFHVGGEYSCGAKISESFLNGICKNLNVKLVYLESSQKLETLECYSCSRERRSLIFEAAKKEGIETVAFGHHQDDSIETLLLNLFHKGEFAGNLPKVPMIHYGITIIRPLIFLTKEQIKSFASMYGYYRITCECPVGQNSKRNTISSIVSYIESQFPNIKNNLAIASLQYGSKKALNP
ncbi:MAG: tRNA 2-thiocytidine biosynthesis protein TtcA [Chlamydiae bacterium]|jgi:tRNA 2-thiocytidine biosynthesis protein TtcA|nr:tRNA 2-thiocytidine biosynthesis protein TtcA [Chlamydiota bacterium]